MHHQSAVRRIALVAGAVVAGAILLGPAPARGGEEALTINEGILDHIVLRTLTLPKDQGVLVRRFSAERASLGTAEKGDNERRVDAAKLMQNEGPRILAETLVETLSLGGVFVFAKVGEEQPAEGVLLVEGRITMIDPGKRSVRWIAPGAGKSGVEVEGVVKDHAGNVLAEFRHRRHSGFGVGGGDYVKFLTDDTKDVARDIATFLKRWAQGGNLQKE